MLSLHVVRTQLPRCLHNSREIAQILGQQNLQSMQVKRSDPQKYYPPFSKHCAREKIIEESFSEGLREVVAIDCVKKTLGELFSGRLHNFIVLLRFCIVFVACFQESICAMAILPLRQNIL